MSKLLCATSNAEKFGIGQQLLKKYGIDLEQVKLEIDEIQSEDVERIIRDKAQKAYALLQKPVIVSDDSWTIPGLNGFPGPYMKSMNHWFTPNDFIHLTEALTDRTIYLNQLVAYQDENETVIFRKDIPGTLLKDPRGSFGPAIMRVVSLNGDDSLSIAETYDQGKEHDDARLLRRSDAWYELATWLKRKNTATT
jgi:inosine/xanthosine triphosphate pyrophosphatase family protein